MTNTKLSYVDILKPIKTVNLARDATLLMDKLNLENLVILLIQNRVNLLTSYSCMKTVTKKTMEDLNNDLTIEGDLIALEASQEAEVDVVVVDLCIVGGFGEGCLVDWLVPWLGGRLYVQ